MPFQNRVTPFSSLVSTPERGAWTGNRGVIHNDQQKIIKNHAVKYWITCALTYKDFRRTVMSPNRWTELFFLDEATSFSAGHRPCGFCRHAAFKRFKSLWLTANGTQYDLSEKTKMDAIDLIIHQDRMNENGSKKTFEAVLSTLPDGVFVTLDASEKAFLWFQKQLFEWSFRGYTKIDFYDKNQIVQVLTPSTYVAVFNLGYMPQVHGF